MIIASSASAAPATRKRASSGPDDFSSSYDGRQAKKLDMKTTPRGMCGGGGGGGGGSGGGGVANLQPGGYSLRVAGATPLRMVVTHAFADDVIAAQAAAYHGGSGSSSGGGGGGGGGGGRGGLINSLGRKVWVQSITGRMVETPPAGSRPPSTCHHSCIPLDLRDIRDCSIIEYPVHNRRVFARST